MFAPLKNPANTNNPNVADINAFYGMILRYEGRSEEAENW